MAVCLFHELESMHSRLLVCASAGPLGTQPAFWVVVQDGPAVAELVGGGAATDWSYDGFSRVGVTKVGHVARIAAAFRDHIQLPPAPQSSGPTSGSNGDGSAQGRIAASGSAASVAGIRTSASLVGASSNPAPLTTAAGEVRAAKADSDGDSGDGDGDGSTADLPPPVDGGVQLRGSASAESLSRFVGSAVIEPPKEFFCPISFEMMADPGIGRSSRTPAPPAPASSSAALNCSAQSCVVFVLLCTMCWERSLGYSSNWRAEVVCHRVSVLARSGGVGRQHVRAWRDRAVAAQHPPCLGRWQWFGRGDVHEPDDQPADGRPAGAESGHRWPDRRLLHRSRAAVAVLRRRRRCSRQQGCCPRA